MSCATVGVLLPLTRRTCGMRATPSPQLVPHGTAVFVRPWCIHRVPTRGSWPGRGAATHAPLSEPPCACRAARAKWMASPRGPTRRGRDHSRRAASGEQSGACSHSRRREITKVVTSRDQPTVVTIVSRSCQDPAAERFWCSREAFPKPGSRTLAVAVQAQTVRHSTAQTNDHCTCM